MVEQSHGRPEPTAGFVGRVIAVLALLGGAWLLVVWSQVLVLVFAAVVVGVLLDGLARPLAKHVRLPRKWAVGLVAVLLVLTVAGALWLFYYRVSAQFADLAVALRNAWAWLQTLLRANPLGAQVAAGAEALFYDTGGGLNLKGVLPHIGGFASTVVNALTSLVLVLVGGLFFAFSPAAYRDGVLRLCPKVARGRLRAVLDQSGAALRGWLVGQGLAMLVVGVPTGLGVWWLGLPAPMALGLLAGLAEFVPFAGPLLSFLPAILLALLGGVHTVVWTALLYLAIQQVESNVIIPVVQRHTVSLMPVATIFAVVAFGVLFGPIGILLATPLVLVIRIALDEFYIRGVLGEDPEQALEDGA